MSRLCAIAILSVACAADTASEGPTVEGSTGSAETMVTGDATAAPSGVGTADASGDHSDSTGTPSAEVPRDCRTLLEQAPGTPDGVYTLHIGGDPESPTFDAYCDMTTEGGGWTLVGRSVEGTWDVLFGWQQATGDVNNDTTPYSLDALNAQLEFSEVLLGSYTRAKTWGANAYVVPAPEHFVFVYGRVPFEVTAEAVIGNCTDQKGGPHHLRYIGWTEVDRHFHVSEKNYVTRNGLESHGWHTDHEPDDCAGGAINGSQGMIMVR